MGEPVRNNPSRSAGVEPLLKKNQELPECGKGKVPELKWDAKGDWHWVCVSESNRNALGGLIGSGFVCGKRGGPPCDAGGPGLGLVGDVLSKEEVKEPAKPAPRPDQFHPPAPKPLEVLITGRAQYNCKTKMKYTEIWTIEQDVSVPAVAGEKTEVTRARLGKAARVLEKTIRNFSPNPSKF